MQMIISQAWVPTGGACAGLPTLNRWQWARTFHMPLCSPGRHGHACRFGSCSRACGCLSSSIPVLGLFSTTRVSSKLSIFCCQSGSQMLGCKSCKSTEVSGVSNQLSWTGVILFGIASFLQAVGHLASQREQRIFCFQWLLFSSKLIWVQSSLIFKAVTFSQWNLCILNPSATGISEITCLGLGTLFSLSFSPLWSFLKIKSLIDLKFVYRRIPRNWLITSSVWDLVLQCPC